VIARIRIRVTQNRQRQRFERRAVSIARERQRFVGPVDTRLPAPAAAGNRARAKELLRALRQKSQGAYVSPYSIAVVEAALGEKRRSIPVAGESLAAA